MARKRQRGRAIDGIFLLNKGAGVSSNYALQGVKNIYFARKAGHTGSLDPLATGMLPVCLGEATKFSAFLLDADKRYEVEARLGEVTETGDAEGEVIKRHSVEGIGLDDVRRVAAGFTGEIDQVPSMYSALKHKGEPLYKLARRGIEVERKARRITIYTLEVLGMEADDTGLVVKMFVHCSKGTYVRTLVEDIGKELGCGAHVTALHRTSVGPFTGDMMTLEELQALKDSVERNVSFGVIDPLLLPVETAFGDWPNVCLTENTAWYLQKGQKVMAPNSPREGMVCLVREKEDGEKEFIGVGEVDDDGMIAPRRLVSTQ